MPGQTVVALVFFAIHNNSAKVRCVLPLPLQSPRSELCVWREGAEEWHHTVPDTLADEEGPIALHRRLEPFLVSGQLDPTPWHRVL